MKLNKTIALIIAALMLLSVFSAACSNGKNSKADSTNDANANTSAPAATDDENGATATADASSETPTPIQTLAPTSEPVETQDPAKTEEPTLEPQPTDEPVYPSEYFYALLEENVPFKCDLDFDGKEDTVTLVSVESEYGYLYSMQFTLGFNPNNTITFDFDYESYFCRAFITDSDRYDSRLDVIACFEYESDDSSICLYRVDNSGYNFDYFEEFSSIVPFDDEWQMLSLDGQFYMSYRTDILGTASVFMLCEASENGFVNVADSFYYDEDSRPIRVISELKVKLIDDDNNYLGDYNLTVGETVIPISTDRRTYVKVQLENQKFAWIDIDFEDGFLPYINGVPQDTYFDVEYAD